MYGCKNTLFYLTPHSIVVIINVSIYYMREVSTPISHNMQTPVNQLEK